jgi:integrase
LKKLYGHTEGAKFGPLAFKAVRLSLINSGLRRSTINGRMSRIQRMFKWAVANEMIPPFVYHGLQVVDGLRAGRGTARESERVEPVPDEHVAAVLPFVTTPVRAMIELQSLTGARPGEIMRMRGCDIDRSSPVWVYRANRHMGQNSGKGRAIPLGPKELRRKNT